MKPSGHSGPIKIDLQGVEETLLIPLWGRARETLRTDAIIRDERAVELVASIDYDFDRFARLDASGVLGTLVPVRTELLDRAIATFIRRHPTATIVNLGAGLDTRFFRLDNGQLTWYEVDLPRSMALRHRLLPPSDRHRYIEGSVLEPAWLEALDVPDGAPVMVVAEGLFMYLPEADLRTLFARLAERLPGADLLFETINPIALAASRQAARWQGMLGINASLRWGLWSGRELELWLPGLRWIETWCYLDQHLERWGPLALGTVLPFVRSVMRIEHVRLPEKRLKA